ncbi:MAG TPA: hypothetical protein VGF67_09440 [Ktedonobacteraceae bacterium]
MLWSGGRIPSLLTGFISASIGNAARAIQAGQLQDPVHNALHGTLLLCGSLLRVASEQLPFLFMLRLHNTIRVRIREKAAGLDVSYYENVQRQMVVRKAGAARLIGKLPARDETMPGRTLAGGQWQSVALAHAFM